MKYVRVSISGSNYERLINLMQHMKKGADFTQDDLRGLSVVCLSSGLDVMEENLIQEELIKQLDEFERKFNEGVTEAEQSD